MKSSKSIFSISLLAVSFLFYNCNAQQVTANANLEEAKVAIAKSNSIYFQAFVKGDSSLFIDRYAKDCCIMPPNTPAMCSVNSPLEFFRIAYIQMGLRNGNFITTDVFGNGEEFVTEMGLFQLFDSGNVMIDNGKYLVLWKKTANEWKMFRDSFSSNNPAKGDK
ncbi:MAG: nuclear transport factor 2 family protein [Chitinophagaceae bacterium]|nr:nuclear transport factor 2 family protein [Chitinophagaceae bacterium]